MKNPEDEIDELITEIERLKDEVHKHCKTIAILHAEVKETKAALVDARQVIREAVNRIKPLWPFVAAWLPDEADRNTEDVPREVN